MCSCRRNKSRKFETGLIDVELDQKRRDSKNRDYVNDTLLDQTPPLYAAAPGKGRYDHLLPYHVNVFVFS